MFFKVEYDSDDQMINLPDDLNLRLEKLRELKKRGYTHIKDKWMTLYTGEVLTPINTYITETKSYL
tara:strand:+ start:78 stop:275 length:198 start_codon:yes stop_codon:yes gene_type:complete